MRSCERACYELPFLVAFALKSARRNKAKYPQRKCPIYQAIYTSNEYPDVESNSVRTQINSENSIVPDIIEIMAIALLEPFFSYFEITSFRGGKIYEII